MDVLEVCRPCCDPPSMSPIGWMFPYATRLCSCYGTEEPALAQLQERSLPVLWTIELIPGETDGSFVIGEGCLPCSSAGRELRTRLPLMPCGCGFAGETDCGCVGITTNLDLCGSVAAAVVRMCSHAAANTAEAG
jgi:hypothetical protein